MILSELAGRVLHGPDRWTTEARTGLKVVKVRDNLLVYRHGERKLWIDLEVRLIVAWCVRTEAEVKSFNRLLKDLGLEDFYEFVRSGRNVLLNAGGKWYHAVEYNEKFGPLGRSHSLEGHGD